MEILRSVYTTYATVCCTPLWQAEISEKNIKCDEKIHRDTLQNENLIQSEPSLDKDVVKLIIAPNKLRICKVCEEFSENSKTKSSNASTNAEKFCSHNARFTEQCKCIKKQKKDVEWKMEVTVTDNNGYLSNLDEPHRNNALKLISSEIDIQDFLKLSSRAESTRLPVPQSVVTCSTENCKCRTGNLTTSTAYMSCQEENIEDKAKTNRRPFVKLRKRIVTIFRRCFHKNIL